MGAQLCCSFVPHTHIPDSLFVPSPMLGTRHMGLYSGPCPGSAQVGVVEADTERSCETQALGTLVHCLTQSAVQGRLRRGRAKFAPQGRDEERYPRQ